MIERLLLDRIDAEPGAAAVCGGDHLPVGSARTKQKPRLPSVEAAAARAESQTTRVPSSDSCHQPAAEMRLAVSADSGGKRTIRDMTDPLMQKSLGGPKKMECRRFPTARYDGRSAHQFFKRERPLGRPFQTLLSVTVYGCCQLPSQETEFSLAMRRSGSPRWHVRVDSGKASRRGNLTLHGALGTHARQSIAYPAGACDAEYFQRMAQTSC